MFVREKTVNGYTKLYLVESVRENGRTVQHIIRNLGRKRSVPVLGALDRRISVRHIPSMPISAVTP